MEGKKVRPQKWSNVLDLHDDGDWSAVWGNYEGNTDRCLGIRWNGEANEIGYPSVGNNPTWFVVPEAVTDGILSEMVKKVNTDNSKGVLPNILTALKEFSERA